MAEFYSARGWEIPPLPWTNLSPPFSAIGPQQRGAPECVGKTHLGAVHVTLAEEGFVGDPLAANRRA